MNRYRYHALNHAGQAIDGWVDAADRQSAVTQLLQKGHFVKEIEDTSAGNKRSDLTAVANAMSFKRIQSKEILSILTQLSAALKSGLPLLDGLKVIREQQQKPAGQKLLDELMEAINQGKALSSAMEQQPRYFKSLACAMVRVGEVGGILDQTTERLVQILKREEKIKSNIKVALSYPAFVLAIGIVSVSFIISFILPRVLGALGDAIILPWPTKLLLGIGSAITGYWWLLLLCGGLAIWGGFQFYGTAAGRLAVHRFYLKIPILGNMLTAIAVGRFARTLGALGRGGVTILESLSVVKDILGNQVLINEMDVIEEKVKSGQALSKALAESGYFPPLLVQVTSMGEQTGELDILLFNAAETFEEQADVMIEKFMALLPAILMIGLFIVIGFIVLGILLPIMGMDFAPTGN